MKKVISIFLFAVIGFSVFSQEAHSYSDEYNFEQCKRERLEIAKSIISFNKENKLIF